MHTKRTSIHCHHLSYTFKAFIDFPIEIASHSPGAVDSPVGIVIPAICGDHAIFTISDCPVYAITGSEMMRFLASGRGELSPELAFRGDAAGTWVYPEISQSKS